MSKFGDLEIGTRFTTARPGKTQEVWEKVGEYVATNAKGSVTATFERDEAVDARPEALAYLSR